MGYTNNTDPDLFSKCCNFGYLENSAYAISQMKDKPSLIWLAVAIAITEAFYKAFGVGVTKYSMATARSTIRTASTLTVWIVSASLGL